MEKSKVKCFLKIFSTTLDCIKKKKKLFVVMVHIGNYYSYPMVTIQFKIILIWILLILDGFLGIELFLKKKKKKTNF